MAGFNDNFAVMGEWVDCSPNHKKRSKAELDREASLEEDIKDMDLQQTNFQERSGYSQGGLSERIAARAGFKVASINTESSLQSLCLNISSPGVSPATLLESPVFLSNPLVTFQTFHYCLFPFADPFLISLITCKRSYLQQQESSHHYLQILKLRMSSLILQPSV